MPGVGPLPSSAAGGEVERIRAGVAAYFPVYETRVTPQSLVLLVHADPAKLEERFDQLRREFWTRNYIPILRYDRGEYIIEVIRRPPRRPYGGWTNLVLLAATVVTTVFAGAFLWLAYVGGATLVPSDFLFGGITFALPLMAILGLHELAHFILARHHHVEASLPYFLPVPPPFLLFGTFGAFISLREPIPNRKALLDIGASGPLAGFAVSIPVTIFGMFLSAHAPVLSVANCGPTILGVNYGNLLFGVSLFWALLGQFIPIAFVNLSPVALAGWVGILVTAINLLPAGQLDGGHVFRALFGDRSRFVSYAAVILLFGLIFFYPGWAIFGILILLLGVRHPPPLNDVTPLDAKRWAVGFLAAGILVSGFVLVPISTPAGAFSVSGTTPSHISLPPGFAMADNATLTIQNTDPVSHGYLFATSISSVNGSSRLLNGSALASFEANSTWIFYFPNGTVSTFHGATVNLPPSSFLSVNAGAKTTLTVSYLNPQRATVQLVVMTSELCNAGGPPAMLSPFTVS